MFKLKKKFHNPLYKCFILAIHHFIDKNQFSSEILFMMRDFMTPWWLECYSLIRTFVHHLAQSLWGPSILNRPNVYNTVLFSFTHWTTVHSNLCHPLYYLYSYCCTFSIYFLQCTICRTVYYLLYSVQSVVQCTICPTVYNLSYSVQSVIQCTICCTVYNLSYSV